MVSFTFQVSRSDQRLTDLPGQVQFTGTSNLSGKAVARPTGLPEKTALPGADLRVSSQSVGV